MEDGIINQWIFQQHGNIVINNAYFVRYETKPPPGYHRQGAAKEKIKGLKASEDKVKQLVK